MAYVRVSMTEPAPAPGTQPPAQPAMQPPSFWQAHVFTRENFLATALCLMLVVIIILTSDNAPRWIYQGF